MDYKTNMAQNRKDQKSTQDKYHNTIDAQSDWDLGNLEVKATSFLYRHFRLWTGLIIGTLTSLPLRSPIHGKLWCTVCS